MGTVPRRYLGLTFRNVNASQLPARPVALSNDDLNIVRAEQEKWFYCAPASAAMVTEPLGLSKTQDDIWAETRPLMQDSAHWYTDPAALGGYLNSAFQASGGQVNEVFSIDWKIVVHQLVRGITHHNLSGALLVLGGKHWVVCSGARVGFLDVGRTQAVVSGLFVTDPAVGQTDITFRPLSSATLGSYLLPTKIPGGWKDNYVAVATTADHFASFDILESDRPIGGAGILTDIELTDLVVGDLQSYGMPSSELLGGGGVSVIRVNNLAEKEIFQIVPVDHAGTLTWVVVAAEHLTVQAVTSSPLPPPPDDAQCLAAAREVAPGHTGTVSPSNYWEDCMQLRTEFEFFRKVEFAGRNPLYVTNRGRVLDAITYAPGQGFLAG